MLYLAISHIEDRTTSRGGTPKNPSITQRGGGTNGWKNALNHFAIIYLGRLPEGIEKSNCRKPLHTRLGSHDGNCIGDLPAGLTRDLTGSMSMPWL
ncbi:MAG: hypothetical protein HQ453_02620 [Actinobacteria bacterium]|nr:hypothetical protein [Actinomycetota bacterium]